MLLMGCAKLKSTTQSEELTPYIKRLKTDYFIITGEQLNTRIPMSIKELDSGKGAICHKEKGLMNSTKEIFVNRSIFERHKDSYDYITTIILHEVGHCIYGFEHDTSVMKMGNVDVPTSIMHESALRTIPLMNELKEYYYKEFSERVKLKNLRLLK